MGNSTFAIFNKDDIPEELIFAVVLRVMGEITLGNLENIDESNIHSFFEELETENEKKITPQSELSDITHFRTSKSSISKIYSTPKKNAREYFDEFDIDDIRTMHNGFEVKHYVEINSNLLNSTITRNLALFFGGFAIHDEGSLMNTKYIIMKNGSEELGEYESLSFKIYDHDDSKISFENGFVVKDEDAIYRPSSGTFRLDQEFIDCLKKIQIIRLKPIANDPFVQRNLLGNPLEHLYKEDDAFIMDKALESTWVDHIAVESPNSHKKHKKGRF